MIQENNTCCYVSGCIDPIALNYDPNACYDDGSCCFIAGCNPLGFNYDPLACYDDGSCVYCNINGTFFANNPTTPTNNPTTPTACDGFAVFNVTSYYPVVSYTWTTISGANISNTNMAFGLCNDVYIVSATDSGNCTFNDTLVLGTIFGTDPLATNYNSFATNNDGTCTYPNIYGCMDPLHI